MRHGHLRSGGSDTLAAHDVVKSRAVWLVDNVVIRRRRGPTEYFVSPSKPGELLFHLEPVFQELSRSQGAAYGADDGQRSGPTFQMIRKGHAENDG